MWDDISFLRKSRTASKILKGMKKPTTPSDIAYNLDLEITSLSHSLSKLTDRKLAKCLTPDRRSFKYFQTTSKGSNILKKMKKMGL